MSSPYPGPTLAQPRPAHRWGFLGRCQGRGGWGHRWLADRARRRRSLARRRMGRHHLPRRRSLMLRRGYGGRHGCPGRRVLCGRRAVTAPTGAARWGNAQRLGEEFVGRSRPARLRRRRLPARCRIGHAPQCRSQPAGPPVAAKMPKTSSHGFAAWLKLRHRPATTVPQQQPRPAGRRVPRSPRRVPLHRRRAPRSPPASHRHR